MAVTSRNTYYQKRNSVANLINLSSKQEQERKVLHNLIEERAIHNTGSVINLTKTSTLVNYYYQIVGNDNEVNLNPANQTSDNLVKYGCVRDLPLQFTEEIKISDEGDEVLQSFILSGSAIVLPNTILPKPNDYFSFRYNNRSFLYRVDKVDMDSTHEYPARLISFHVDSTAGRDFNFDSWALKNNIVKWFTFIEKHLGTDFKPIVADKEVTDLNKITDLYNYMCGLFFRHFFDRQCNTFLLKYKDFNFREMKYEHVDTSGDEMLPQSIYKLKYEPSFYDALLIQFLKTNKVFSRSPSNKVISISHLMEVDFDLYDNSIFKAVEDRNPNYFKLNFMKARQVTKVDNIFSTSLYSKYVIEHTNLNSEEYFKFLPDNLGNIINKKAFKSAAETTYDTPTTLLCEVVSLWVNNGSNEEILERLRILENSKESLILTNVYPNNAFYMYPLVSYIINKVLIDSFKNHNY